LKFFDAIIETSEPDSFSFKIPPYEYEYKMMPFDILSGDSGMRETLTGRKNIRIEKERWSYELKNSKGIQSNSILF